MTSSSEQTTALRDSIAKVLDGHQVDWASARDDGVWCECGTSVTPPTWEAVTRHQADFVMVKVAPRVVSTPSELEALPHGSVIRCNTAGQVALVIGTKAPHDFYMGGRAGGLRAEAVDLPATVLWVGGTE